MIACHHLDGKVAIAQLGEPFLELNKNIFLNLILLGEVKFRCSFLEDCAPKLQKMCETIFSSSLDSMRWIWTLSSQTTRHPRRAPRVPAEFCGMLHAKSHLNFIKFTHNSFHNDLKHTINPSYLLDVSSLHFYFLLCHVF